MNRTPILLLALLAATFAWTTAARADEAKPLVLDVWPGKPPGETKDIGLEKLLSEQPGERQVQRLTNVSRPTISVFRPPADKDTGAAVLIAPGGGYHILAWDLEGEEVAAWLNSIGVTGIVLKYRVPRREGQEANRPQLQDAQRAMSLVRSKAPQWKIDPRRIGMLGFSAGGHLTATTAAGAGKRVYDAIDEVDKQSYRPDFAVLVYPAYLVEKDKDALTSGLRVDVNTPPMFFAHAADDNVDPANSAGMFLALTRAGVPAEAHLYASGGHGFGLRPSEHPCSRWPEQCERWMRSRGFLPAK